ncbi:MAG: hypothetical protein ABR955_15655 [Verrucomicrobiota bacterium]|jgi:hypothetical protein
MKSPPSPPSDEDKENKKRDDLVKQFRAYLHLVITAKQNGQDKNLEAWDGPRMQDYCRALTQLPENTLAWELSRPLVAIIDQIFRVSRLFESILRSNDEKFVARHAPARRILNEIDGALNLVLRHQFLSLLSRRAGLTQCQDLLCEVLYGMAIGENTNAAYLLRRWQREFPEEARNKDGSMSPGSFPDSFAWDVYQRVEALDRLADEFPEYIRTAARRMHAWPMLVHRHTKNRSRFEQLAKRLELGEEYPTDAGEGARFRPDTPLVQYLDLLIYRLHILRSETGDRQFESLKEEQKWLHQDWWQWPDDPPGEEILVPLREARQLPPLTKATAKLWAKKAIVPYILVTDALDYANCAEPALRQIAKQKGVKSLATFKSRLLAAVTATLRRLARPA